MELIIDRNSSVCGRGKLSVSHETGQVQGQRDDDLCTLSLVTPGPSICEGDETVVTQGYEVNGQQGLYPPEAGDRTGLARDRGHPDGLEEFVTVRPAIDAAPALEFVLVLPRRPRGGRRLGDDDASTDAGARRAVIVTARCSCSPPNISGISSSLWGFA